MSKDIEFKIQLTAAELAMDEQSIWNRIRELCRCMSKVVTFGNRINVDPDEMPETLRAFVPKDVVSRYPSLLKSTLASMFFQCVQSGDNAAYMVRRRPERK